MAPEEKIWFNKEADRLLNYQHQHRGLSFLKLRLPPTADRKVNLVGLDDHVYRGSIPKLPEDKLPSNVDEKSIDEEALYKEIRDMNFPPVPPLEPLGPSRRIGGSYTLTRKMNLAPVKVDCGEKLEDIHILGKDGGIYKGLAKHPSKVELDRQIRGTKRSIQVVREQSSSRGFIEPTLISLQKDGQSKPFGRQQKSFVELPAENVGKIIELILSQNKKAREDKTETQQITEKDVSHPEQTESKDTEDVESENTESRESENAENKESEDTETKESEDAENTEESEDAENAEESDAAENEEESEEAETEKEPEDTEHENLENEESENKE